MRIILNGEPAETAARTLADLCDSLGHPPATIATAKNGDFVPNTARRAVTIEENDRIEIVSPRQGG